MKSSKKLKNICQKGILDDQPLNHPNDQLTMMVWPVLVFPIIFLQNFSFFFRLSFFAPWSVLLMLRFSLHRRNKVALLFWDIGQPVCFYLGVVCWSQTRICSSSMPPMDRSSWHSRSRILSLARSKWWACCLASTTQSFCCLVLLSKSPPSPSRVAGRNLWSRPLFSSQMPVAGPCHHPTSSGTTVFLFSRWGLV